MTNVFLGTIFETNIKLVNMNENGYDTVGMHNENTKWHRPYLIRIFS